MERGLLGVALIAVGAVGLLAVFGASALTAPTHEVTGPHQTRTLVSVQGGGVGLHHGGNVRLLDGRGQTRWHVSNADSYFGAALSNGTLLAGFVSGGYHDCGPYDSPCVRTGYQLVDPATGTVHRQYSYPVRTGTNSETHDVERLPSGEFLLTDMEHERVFTVAPNGTITWQWNASSYYDAPADPTRVDWLHVNDADRIGPGRFLVSVRNANQLLVIERGRGVVEVVNEDRDPSLLNHQHNPQWLSPNAILVADSGNDRIVELHRNRTTDEWAVAWALYRADGLAFDWPRDADRLPNGHTLITDSSNKRVVEVAPNGSVVWSATEKRVPYEADRLPYGERVGAPTYDQHGTVTETPGGGDSVPVLTTTLSIIQSGYPLPYWFTEWHLLALVVGGLAIVAGAVLVLAARVRG
ncbi:MAG: aryl-sulfate sulfotransferase [Haloarculaceae archaeon]